MRGFIDSSTLLKKYKEEPGRDQFLQILETIDEIVVSPVTYVEVMCSMKRVCEEFRLKNEDFLKFKNELDLDFSYFHKIPFNDDLERTAFDLRQECRLKTLDLIQISSAKMSHAKIFLTSDKLLHKIASQVLKNVEVELVG